MSVARMGQEMIPALRFPEFSDQWQFMQLKNLAAEPISYGVVQPSFNRPDGVPFLRGGDFPSGVIDPKCLRKIPQVVSSQYRRTILTGGELVVSLVGYPGACAVVPNSLSGANVARQVAVVRPKKNCVVPFVYQYMISMKGQRRLLSKVVGSAQQVINLVDLRKLFIPDCSTMEQQKIADFLDAVDARLSLLRRRRDALRNYKRWVMQRLFSQELRFTRDDGTAFPDWQAKRLGEVLTIGNGRDYKHLEPGNVPVYGTGGRMTYVNDWLCDGDSVCIGRKGTIDSPMFLSGKFWTVDTLFFTHGYRGVMPRFVFAVFQRINWLKHNEASGVPSLSKSTIAKLQIKVPHLDEQRKIADCLSALDLKINAVTGQVSAMRTFKESLLQQMFV